jgi:ABC-2 type transport system ATP-binding protein
MLALVRKVGHQLGIDVLLSSHLLEEVERVSDAVVILEQGKTVAGGTMSELGDRGEAELLVDIDGDDKVAAQLVTALTKAGVAAVVDGHMVVVALESDRVYDIVRDTVVSSGIGLRRLERRRTSLEDVYLAAGSGGSQ